MEFTLYVGMESGRSIITYIIQIYDIYINNNTLVQQTRPLFLVVELIAVKCFTHLLTT
jgi:hypothetical protein